MIHDAIVSDVLLTLQKALLCDRSISISQKAAGDRSHPVMSFTERVPTLEVQSPAVQCNSIRRLVWWCQDDTAS